MSKDMLGSLVRVLVNVPVRFLGLVLDIVDKIQNSLEAFVIPVPATQRFVAKDHFKVGSAGIYFLGDNFKSWFSGKVEDERGESTLVSYTLSRDSSNIPIITELGGEDECETTLAKMWKLIEAQSDGREGELLVNGYANFFYIRDKNGVLRAVDAYWDAGHGWRVGACALGSPIGWNAEYRVFSRK